MKIDDIALGKVVYCNVTEEVILGIYWNTKSFVNYVYGPELIMYLVTYPYMDGMLQTGLNPQLISYRHNRELSYSNRKIKLSKEDLKLWIAKSVVQAPDLAEVIPCCNMNIDTMIPYLKEERVKFLFYRNNCKTILNRNEKRTVNRLKLGEVYRNNIDSTRIIVYLGKNLFLKTRIAYLEMDNFVLVDSSTSYRDDIVDRTKIDLEYYKEDTGLNLCDLHYNKEKMKEIVNVI